MFAQLIKVSFSTFLFLFILTVAKSQKQSLHWYFGNKAGITFSSGTATTLTGSAMNAPEGVATISDKEGNLLFYTDGISIWNRQHQFMPNAPWLLGHPSSTQSGIIVPQPGNDSIFYVFSVDAFGGPDGLTYVLVNMNKDNGLGDVITNIPIRLIAPTCEKITALKHCNNKDIWIITRDLLNSSYYAWLVTATGISGAPVISLIPHSITSEIGYLKGSPDGKKLAAVHFSNYTELSEFDNASGVVFNTLKIAGRQPIAGNTSANSYGVEFSPDNNLLYISTAYRTSPSLPLLSSIEQFNISSHDSTTIEQSNYTVSLDSDIHYALQLGYDNKIYAVNSLKNYLSRINNPNLYGSACNFETNAVSLGTNLGYSGLPTFIQSLFNPGYGGYNFSSNNECNSLLSRFIINDLTHVDSVKWNFDDPASGMNNYSANLNPSHLFTNSGTYNVMLRIFRTSACLSGIDTIVKSITVNQINFNLGLDREICEGLTLTLDATTPGISDYLWNTGAVTPALSVTQEGEYWCRIIADNCSIYDTVTVTGKTAPDFTLGPDTSVCMNRSLILSPAVDPAWQLVWQDGSSQSTYTVTTPGIYSLRATNTCGSLYKTIAVDQQFIPDFSLGNDTAICFNHPLLLKPVVAPAWQLFWQDGSTQNTYTVTAPGHYTLTANNSCGAAKKEIEITNGICEVYIPSSFTPNGDSKNDLFKVFHAGLLYDFQLELFNRYGQLVFGTKDQNTGWDGSYKGKPSGTGVYVYILKYKTGPQRKPERLQGGFVLIR